MNLSLSLEHRFDRTPDGAIWTQTMFAYPFWTRYLAVFDGLRVVARVRDVKAVPGDWRRADGPDVSFAGVPHYLGPRQYLQRARAIRRAARDGVGVRDAVILRVSSPIAAHIVPSLRRSGQPYGVEVLGDPYDVFAPGAVRHPLRPFLRRWFTRQLREQCRGASAAAYVTEWTLQRRYPPAPDAYMTYYSDVELPPEAFARSPRAACAHRGPFTLVTVGSLAQMYKAPDVQIDAVTALVREGLDLRLVLIGDGKHRPELEARVAAHGMTDRIAFRGQMTAGAPVRAELDAADLFLLPSRTEGLPRAMVEAMARGLPCVGSTVGGIPELLPSDDLVLPGDVAALAAKIRAVITDPERMARMSARNLAASQDYRESALRARREAFYRALRERTERWLAANTAS